MKMFLVLYMIFCKYIQKRETLLTVHFHFPPNIRIGLLKECLVIEYCSPEEVDSDILSIQGQDYP